MFPNISQQKELRNGNKLIWGSFWWHLNRSRSQHRPQPHRWGRVNALGSLWCVSLHSVHPFLSPMSLCPSPLQPHHKYLSSSNMEDILTATKLMSILHPIPEPYWLLRIINVIKWFARGGACLPAVSMISKKKLMACWCNAWSKISWVDLEIPKMRAK